MQPVAFPVPDPPAHQLERIRDIPRNCPCTYERDAATRTWQRVAPGQGCPWHYQPGRGEQ